jgi:hypothetical protein
MHIRDCIYLIYGWKLSANKYKMHKHYGFRRFKYDTPQLDTPIMKKGCNRILRYLLSIFYARCFETCRIFFFLLVL